MYLLVKGIDGLGCNIATLLSAIVLAKKTNRHIIIDWRFDSYVFKNKNIFEYLFENNEFTILNHNHISKSFFPKVWNNKNINKPLKTLSLDINDLKINANSILKAKEETIVMIHVVNLDKAHIVNSITYDYSIILRTILTPHYEVRRKIKVFYERFMKLDKFIGIHIRHGNSELENKRKIDNLKEYFTILDNLRKNPKYAKYKIFICSDNFRVVSDFVTRYKNRVVHSYKWYPIADTGGKMHNSIFCPDIVKCVQDALVDIYLLSQCSILIRPDNSWFSKIPHYIPNKAINITKIVNCQL